MIYTANITTPSNTAQTDLKHTVLHVTTGLVYKVEVYFPPGSAGLMGVAIFDGLFQVWPSTVGVFFIGDNLLISYDDLYLKEAAPYQFDIYTYNEDTVYDHLAIVKLGLVSKEVFRARFLPYEAYDYFTRLLEQISEEKAAAAANQKEQLAETPFDWLLKQEAELE